jgi:hypothetical protein
MVQDKILIQTIGLQRSGNHAIINWIGSLFQSAMHLNNLPHDFFTIPDNVKKINEMRADCVICSFEDCRKSSVYGKKILDGVKIACEEDFKQRRCVVLFVLRDPYNCWASRVAANAKYSLTSFSNFDVFSENWRVMAQLYNERPDSFVLYNKWVADAGYRRSVCDRLGGRYTERTLDEVDKAGRGSSFDGYSIRPSYRSIIANLPKYTSATFLRRFTMKPRHYIGRLLSPTRGLNGRDLQVDSRWRHLLDKASSKDLFSDADIRVSSWSIFGFYVDETGMQKRE